MKKILTIAAVALAACSTNAFAENEGFYLGGSVGFMHQSEAGKPSVNTFTILPEVGYNFNSTWAVGTTIGYEHKHWCNKETSLNLFEFNPYARWTFFRTSNNLVQLFVDGGAGIGTGRYSYDGDDNEHTAVIWNAGFRPGIAINVTEKFSVLAHLGFLGYKGANNAAFDAGYNRMGGIAFDTNDLTLGFYYNF